MNYALKELLWWYQNYSVMTVALHSYPFLSACISCSVLSCLTLLTVVYTFIQLIYRPDNGEILGVHIFGLHAADLIHEASNAIALETHSGHLYPVMQQISSMKPWIFQNLEVWHRTNWHKVSVCISPDTYLRAKMRQK